jgi:FixJ family two-component response regulator
MGLPVLNRSSTLTALQPSIVALVEDDADVRGALTRIIAALGYAVSAFASAEAFVLALCAEPPGTLPWRCLLTDFHLPGMSGLALLRSMRNEHQHRAERLPAILMSGQVSSTLRQEALAAGALAMLNKPLDPVVLREELRRAIEGALGE